MDSDPARYDASYAGSEDGYFPKSYALSMNGKPASFRRRDFLQGSPAKRWALLHIQRTCPPGSHVLDIGCGTGLFLEALRRAGFAPLGLDVSDHALTFPRQHGHRVSAGSIGNYPQSWPTPAVVSMIEVLEHLVDPTGTMAEIRARFPAATMLVTVPAPRRVVLLQGRGPGDGPPNQLTRWTERALRLAMRTAGYEATVRVEPVRGNMLPMAFEPALLGASRRFFGDAESQGADRRKGKARSETTTSPKSALWWAAPYRKGRAHVHYRMVKDVLLYPLALRYRLKGYTGSSLFAVGQPRFEGTL